MTIRQRLYPTKSQATAMARHNRDARRVWNTGLQQQNMWQPLRTAKITYTSQAAELTLARQEFDWLRSGSVIVQQQALRDLDQAFQNWWKNPGHFGRPTWRNAGQHEGFRIVELSVRTVSRKWGEVLVPKVGYVRFRLTRQWSEIKETKSARFTLDRAGRWHASFPTPQPAFNREASSAAVGLDMGITASVTTSAAEHLRMPALLTSGEAQRKRRLQRQMARQQEGSNRREQTRLAIAKISATEADRRKDWIEKATTDLVRANDLIAIEDLDTLDTYEMRERVKYTKRRIAEMDSRILHERLDNRLATGEVV